MTQATSDAVGRDLHSFVDAFESAWRRHGRAELAEFLPPAGHPLRRQVLCELVRVDLVLHWSAGHPKRLEEYQSTLPALFEDADALREAALEECRLRRQAGEEPDLDDYLRRFGCAAEADPAALPAVPDDRPAGDPRTVQMPDPAAPSEAMQRQRSDDRSGVGEAVNTLPASGEEFLGFKLLAELGRGAFGRVFLAQQSNLANRLVALKIGTDLFAESQTLAQLQHTNIVPIYSLHRAGQLQAVCMPFFGATTFGDVVKEYAKVRSLPASGKTFIATLNQRHSVTRQSASSACRGATGAGAADAAAPAGAKTESSLEAVLAPWHRHTADLARLEQLSYVEAVLWVAARLAEGLSHAHDRGIIHRDLKPANILLSDDGQPMLLDFNLSADTKAGAALSARLGGTLPYMSPEQLEAFQGKPRAVDARSDLYSLGVILYELLDGRHPFPRPTGGGLDTMLPRLLEDRGRPHATVRRLGKMISPAAASIVRHCLEVDPAHRYQSAHELACDLKRHLENLPLCYAKETSLVERGRKWVRRHPRWAVSLLVAAAAGLLIGTPAVWLVARDREAAQLARTTRDHAGHELRAIRSLLSVANPDPRDLDEGLERNHEVLGRYHVLDDSSWRERTTMTYLPPHERERLVEDVRDLLYLQARALARRAEDDHEASPRAARLREALHLSEVAERESPDGAFSGAWWAHRARLARRLGREDEAERFETRAAAAPPPRTTRDRFYQAMDRVRGRHYQDALKLLQAVTREEPQNDWAWYCLALCFQELGNDVQAVACYNTCLALVPDSYVFHYSRGQVYARSGRFDPAAYDFEEAVRLRPDRPEPHLARGLLDAKRGGHKEAVAEFTTALDLGSPQTRLYFLRARSLAKLGDAPAAARDHAEGLRRTPTDEVSWTERGLARLPKDPKGALADIDEALKLNPTYFAGLQNKAHVLSEHLKREEDALKVLDEEVKLYPDFVLGRLGRGVVRARRGDRNGAVEDARAALAIDPNANTNYGVACVYALTSQKEPLDQDLALLYLSRGLNGGFGADLVDGDADLDPIRKLPEFRQIVDAAKKLRSAARDKNK